VTAPSDTAVASAVPGQAPTTTDSTTPSNDMTTTATTDGEKEKGSLATSATHAGSARRTANKSGGSDRPSTPTKTSTGAPMNGQPKASPTANGTSNGAGGARAKKGLLAKLKGVLLSCVGPSGAHPVLDDDKPASSRPRAAVATPAPAQPTTTAAALETTPAPPTETEKEKVHVAHPTDESAETQARSPASLDAAAEALDTPDGSPSPPAVLQVIPPSPPASDADVLVPPTPTKKKLPDDETGGLTSGAVQPPGSTGDISHNTDHSAQRTHDSENESEGTSFTDEEHEEHEHIDEEQDEEDRLINNGGAGIPIGPVSIENGRDMPHICSFDLVA
jgi:RNA polymerase II subunit A small phosphatase-like protein